MQKKSRARAASELPPAASPAETVRFKCPCGSALSVPAWQVDGRGVCPACRKRLLLTGKQDASGRMRIHPLVLADEDAPSGRTFLIEDHFREIPAAPDRIPFACPCGKKLVAPPERVDKKGRCPACGTRLLLVGKTDSRRRLGIQPLVLDGAGTGDTMVVEG